MRVDEIEAALITAWERSYLGLVGVLTAVTGSRSEAEDVVQDAFAKALRSWRRGIPREPEAWLRIVAINQARSRWRRRQRGRELSRLMPGPVDAGGVADERVVLQQALRSLPAGQREVLVLFYFLDLPLDEIARELGLKVGTVKARLSRGRTALAALVPDLDPALSGTQEVQR